MWESEALWILSGYTVLMLLLTHDDIMKSKPPSTLCPRLKRETLPSRLVITSSSRQSHSQPELNMQLSSLTGSKPQHRSLNYIVFYRIIWLFCGSISFIQKAKSHSRSIWHQGMGQLLVPRYMQRIHIYNLIHVKHHLQIENNTNSQHDILHQ